VNSELLGIVNEQDSVVGRDVRVKVIETGAISRKIVVLLKDADGKYLLSRRAATKKYFPNRLDASVCGTVRSGESYEAAALRELEEELGIICSVKPIKKMLKEFVETNGKKARYFISVFIGVHSGAIRLNEETTSIQPMHASEISQ
jgi:isopentenyldiphosphate isomerase